MSRRLCDFGLELNEYILHIPLSLTIYYDRGNLSSSLSLFHFTQVEEKRTTHGTPTRARILTSGSSISTGSHLYLLAKASGLCSPSDFVRVITMRPEGSRRTKCRRSEEVYIDQTGRWIASRRVASRRAASLRARLRQLDYVNGEPSDIIRPSELSRRGVVEPRCSMAAGIPRFKRTVEYQPGTIGVGEGLTLHKYNPSSHRHNTDAVRKTPLLCKHISRLEYAQVYRVSPKASLCITRVLPNLSFFDQLRETSFLTILLKYHPISIS